MKNWAYLFFYLVEDHWSCSRWDMSKIVHPVFHMIYCNVINKISDMKLVWQKWWATFDYTSFMTSHRHN